MRRRYCVRNGLDRLASLTYAPEHLPEDRDGVWADIELLRRALTKALGHPIPILAVIERGGKNDRLHVHLAFGEFIPKAVMEAAWGRGFVDLRKLKVQGKGKRERCRRAAAYLSKYVSKSDGSDDRGFNRRRYSVTKGYGVVRRSQFVDSYEAGLELAQSLCGGEVVWAWHSISDPDWPGPPVSCVHFGDP